MIYNNTNNHTGEYICNVCGSHIDFDGKYNAPICPTCGSATFTLNNSETYIH